MKLAKSLIEAQERVIGILMQSNAHKHAVRRGAYNQFHRDLTGLGYPQTDRTVASVVDGKSISWSAMRSQLWKDASDMAKLRLAATEDEDAA